MPRTKNKFEQLEIRDTLALASIIGTLPREMVEASLAGNRDRTQRIRTLPPVFIVYFLIFLSIFKDKSTDEVLRMLFEGLDKIIKDKALLSASDAAISKARQRVGKEPLEKLFRSFCTPLCDANKNSDAYYCGFLKCAIDASEIYLQCTSDVLAEFPVIEDENKNPQSCPKLKFAGVMELGSHVFFDVEAGNALKSEQDFADELIGRLGKGKLLLGDRLYTSVLNILRVREQGSEVLFRASDNLTLASKRKLPDGSYIAGIKASRDKRRHAEKYRSESHPYDEVFVRVIPYSIQKTDGTEVGRGRLVTTLMDPSRFHAKDLANIYAERWEEEMGFDEAKVHLMKGAQDNLRSKKANLVWQEFWTTLIAHYIIRKIIFQASGIANEIPRKISFVGTRNILQRKTTTRLFSPSSGVDA